MQKVIRGGKVAVLYSPDYGAGWYDERYPELVFHPVIVAWVEGGKKENIKGVIKSIGYTNQYYTFLYGADDLEIEWLPVGTKFQIHEYDGSETIVINPKVLKA